MIHFYAFCYASIKVLTVDFEAGISNESTVGVGVEHTAIAAFILFCHILEDYGAVPQSVVFNLHLSLKISIHPLSKVLVDGSDILLPVR